ncbi:MAG: cyclic nucleotide-binding domain-containing protein [Pseudomonadales bacterium]
MNLTNEHLAKVQLFQKLNDAGLSKLTRSGKLIPASEGTIIISESSQDNMIYAILQGRVDIYVASPGSLLFDKAEGKVVATLKAGDTVGEMALVGQRRRSATVKAKDDVLLACWDPLALESLFEEDHELGYRVLKQLAHSFGERLSQTNMIARNY